MAIYGHVAREMAAMNESDFLLSESTTAIEEVYNNNRIGLRIMNEASADPASYQIFSNESGNYYLAASALQRFCEANNNFNLEDMLGKICQANGVSEAIVVYDYCDEYFVECLAETNILVEKAAEDDAVTLKQTMKWYDNFVSASRKKAENIEDVEDRIKVLKKCVKQMEHCKYSGEGRAKYALKALIPFNDIWRLIARRDAYAGVTGLSKRGLNVGLNIIIRNAATKKATEELMKGSLQGVAGAAKGASLASLGVGVALTAGEIGIRAATYNKMLEKKIKETNEAIDFLEKKLKELKKR